MRSDRLIKSNYNYIFFKNQRSYKDEFQQRDKLAMWMHSNQIKDSNTFRAIISSICRHRVHKLVQKVVKRRFARVLKIRHSHVHKVVRLCRMSRGMLAKSVDRYEYNDSVSIYRLRSVLILVWFHRI